MTRTQKRTFLESLDRFAYQTPLRNLTSPVGHGKTPLLWPDDDRIRDAMLGAGMHPELADDRAVARVATIVCDRICSATTTGDQQQ